MSKKCTRASLERIYLCSLIKFDEKLMQDLNQRPHGQLRGDERIIHDIRIQHTYAGMMLNI